MGSVGVFWAVFLFVIFYAFIQFARNNEVLWQRLKSIAVFRFLLNAWIGIRDWLFGVGKGAQDLVQAGVRQIRSFGDRNTQEQIWDFIGINRLSPRLKIFFFYQAMLRRGKEKNIAKSESQTPAEYRENLTAAFPEAEEDVREMTEEFETARYSRQSVDEEDATKTKSIWARLRARMRRKRG